MVSAKAVSQRLHLHFFFSPEGEKGSRFKVDNSTIQKSVQKKGDCWEAGRGGGRLLLPTTVGINSIRAA